MPAETSVICRDEVSVKAVICVSAFTRYVPLARPSTIASVIGVAPASGNALTAAVVSLALVGRLIVCVSELPLYKPPPVALVLQVVEPITFAKVTAQAFTRLEAL